MARVKIHGLGAVQKKIEETFDRVKSSRQMNNEIGMFVQERIKAQIRRGKPLNDTGKFPKLGKGTVKWRRKLAEFNKTHAVFKDVRSNTTITGQLVNAIKYLLEGQGIISIGVKNNRRVPYVIDKNGKLEKPVLTNLEVQTNLKQLGFILYTAKGLDKAPIIGKRINNIVKKYIRRAIKVNFGS